jgi:hypothetical protein
MTVIEALKLICLHIDTTQGSDKVSTMQRIVVAAEETCVITQQQANDISDTFELSLHWEIES